MARPRMHNTSPVATYSSDENDDSASGSSDNRRNACDVLYASGDSGMSGSGNADGDCTLEFDGNRTNSSDMITVKIDLADPDDMLAKLEMLDLTDEETDRIFDKAKELNRWLRRELSSQSGRGDADVSRSSSFLVSAPVVSLESIAPAVCRGRPERAHPLSVLPPLMRQTTDQRAFSTRVRTPIGGMVGNSTRHTPRPMDVRSHHGVTNSITAKSVSIYSVICTAVKC